MTNITKEEVNEKIEWLKGIIKDMPNHSVPSLETESRLRALEEKMEKKLNKTTFFWILGTLLTILASIISFQTYLIFRLDDKAEDIQKNQALYGREISQINGVLQSIEFINE